MVFICSGSFSPSTSFSTQSLSLYRRSLPPLLLIQRRELTVRRGKYWAGTQASGAVREPLCDPPGQGTGFPGQEWLEDASTPPHSSAQKWTNTFLFFYYFFFFKYYFLPTARTERSEKFPYFHYICKSCCTFVSIFFAFQGADLCIKFVHQLILMHSFALLALLNENMYQQGSR